MSEEPVARMVLFLVGLLFGCFAICHEFLWQKRLRTWHHVEGRVVDLVPGERLPHPKIKYAAKGEFRTFTGNGSRKIMIGETVNVMYDPDGDKAVHDNLSNRLMIPFILGVISVTLTATALAG